MANNQFLYNFLSFQIAANYVNYWGETWFEDIQ